MNPVTRVLTLLRGLWRGGVRGAASDREHQDEVRFHLEMAARRLEERGVAPDEARRQAQLAFGSPTDAREGARDARGGRWLDDLGRDVGFAVRQLRRSPGFALAAILTLALGIGANTALFSVVDGVLLRPIPFADAARLVVVWETDRVSGTTREPASWPDYLDFAREARTLSATAAIIGTEANFTPDEGEPRRLASAGVTHGFFDLVGVRPLLGRAFTADEDRAGGASVVMLGESFWRARFAGDPSVVGRTIRVEDVTWEVVGIVPAGTDFGIDQIVGRAAYHVPYSSAGDIDVWMPLQASAASFPRSTHPFFMLGRLAPDATVPAASEELAAIAARLERDFPENTGRGVFVEPLQDVVFAPVRPVLYLLLGAVALVLLVACVNVANLLLARGAARTREVAVRGALGAGFSRLCRQFLVESVLLSVVGGIAGLVVAWSGLRLLLALAPADVPRVADVAINMRVLAVTLCISLGVGVAFGLVPTLQALRIDVIDAIRGEGRGVSGGAGRRRVREGLVVAELALSVMLVLCTGLLLRSVASALRVDPGFEAARVVKAQYQLPFTRYPRSFTNPATYRFTAELLQRAAAIPGVESAAISSVHPLDAGFTNSFIIVGREAESRDFPEIAVRMVSPGYFATVGGTLRQGRFLAEGDDREAPAVALINQAAADRLFAGRDPIGAEIAFWGIRRRIVGVVGDERFRGITEPAAPALYASTSQIPSNSGVLLVRTTRAASDLAPELQRAIWSVDPQLAVYGVAPMAGVVLESLGVQRFATVVLGAFAALTLVLALVGIHGVLSYATSQRTREIGIRLALGATRGEAAAMVVRGGVALAGVGMVLGLAGAAAGSRFVSGLLYGVTRSDPLTYGAVIALVLTAAVLATGLPARRAARVEPTEALRME